MNNDKTGFEEFLEFCGWFVVVVSFIMSPFLLGWTFITYPIITSTIIIALLGIIAIFGIIYWIKELKKIKEK